MRNRPRRIANRSSYVEVQEDHDDVLDDEAVRAQAVRARAVRVQDALSDIGFASLAPALDCLLESDSLSPEICRQMLLSLLKCESNRVDAAVVDPEVRNEISSYASQIAEQEMKVLVAHAPLKLPVHEVNPKALERFDTKAIALEQQKCAPFVTSMLYKCAGVASEPEPGEPDDIDDAEGIERELGDEPPNVAKSRGRDRTQIATVSLCMLCYARNQRSNLFQMTAAYYAYADNTTKRMVETLHRMGFFVAYETIRSALTKNAEAVLAELKKRVWKERFFVSFDNMNIYEKRRDERLHNKPVQVAYTAGYVCFMHSEHSGEEATWDECYLNANQVDYDAVNQLTGDDFAISDDDLEHYARSARYIMSKVLDEYFPTSTRKQKTKRNGLLLPKYVKWPSPLSERRSRKERADLLPLPTLAIDEASIAGTIDIMRTYAQTLGLEDVAVQDKCIMFKGDYLTVRNMRRAIYRRQREPHPIHSFQFAEPIAGLFHLQMNLLRLLLNALWGQKEDRISLARFKMGLGRQNATRDAKNFHASDDFFRTVIKAFVIALCMHGAKCADLRSFKKWLSENDWPNVIEEVEAAHLGAFKSAEADAAASEALHDEVSAAIAQEKSDWLEGRARDRRSGIITYTKEPDWQMKLKDRVKEAIAAERDIIQENALRFLNLGLLYLDFVDACRGGYSGRVEKCIQSIAVIFQGTSSSKNYAGECLHLVACLKKLWKPEFK